MKPSIHCWYLALAVVACPLTAPAQWRNPFRLFSNAHEDVFIVTDVTPEGRDFVPPTRDEPVYCEAVDFGCSFGSNVGDKQPDPVALRRLIVSLLAKEGYRGASQKHPPSLLLTFQWGYLRGSMGRNLLFLGGDKLELMGDIPNTRESLTRLPWMDTFRDGRSLKVLETARDDIYVATICGFDYAAYKQGEAKLLWKTRIACSTLGTSMQAALPNMITLAAPAVGRETRSVIIANVEDARRGKVVFGELQVIDDDAADRREKRKRTPPEPPAEAPATVPPQTGSEERGPAD